MRLLKPTLALVAACMLGGLNQVSAQTVQFQGTATGCFFYTGPCDPASTQTFYDLTYNQGTFDKWSQNGVLTLGGATNNLGTFTLGSLDQNYSGLGWSFLLNLVFTLPTLANPSAMYTAAIAGVVQSDPILGGVHVMFDETPQTFRFEGPTQSGYFTLTVPELFVPAGVSAVPVTGTITVTPEPATMVLVATGLAGLIPVARRRRKSRE